MKPETVEWLDRADGDLRVAEREIGAADPVLHVVCFLSQQAAEKYIKALMEERCIVPRRTHDLIVLLDLVGEALDPPARARIAALSTFGVSARYPGMDADMESAEEAVATARLVKTLVEHLLGSTVA